MPMFPTAYPALLSVPVPGAIPCFWLPEMQLEGLSRRRLHWDDRCTAILEACAASRSNYEIADLIAARTGKRFSMYVVSRHRAALGLHNRGPHRNDWTSPLRRWKPWQGHLADKS
jgi:hypothetical protein